MLGLEENVLFIHPPHFWTSECVLIKQTTLKLYPDSMSQSFSSSVKVSFPQQSCFAKFGTICHSAVLFQPLSSVLRKVHCSTTAFTHLGIWGNRSQYIQQNTQQSEMALNS